MSFYTNVQQYGNSMLYAGYTKTGKKILKKVPYSPRLFVPSKKPNSNYTTLEGKPVDEIKFDTIKEAKEFMESYKDVSNFAIHGFNKYAYTFIHDVFKDEIEFNPDYISVVFMDIEVKMDKTSIENLISNVSGEVTAISLRKKNDVLLFGFKDYDPTKTELKTDAKIRYIKCKDEYDLLCKFIEIWNSEYWMPDVVTGWNVEFFDFPYLINRITKVLGLPQAKRLSPWKILFEKQIEFKGRKNQTYSPVGITILDYMQLYKKFTYTGQESYSLDNISKVELDEEKLTYSEYGNLDDLYEKNPQKYYDYNIHDTDLVFRIDQKMKLIDLVYVLTYSVKMNYSDALGSVLPWEIAIYNYLMDHNIVMPLKEKKFSEDYEGGYVKDPIVGMHEWVVSFDLTSLYPHLIIQYNISPETFIKQRSGVSVESLLNGSIVNENNDVSMTANGCQYSKNAIGFLPALMVKFFNKRTEYKKEMQKWEKLKEKNGKTPEITNNISKNDNAQKAIKIFLNSAYGAIGNEWFTFYNHLNAEAITTSGQLSIRWVEKHINAFLNRSLKTSNVDYVIAMDTDSMYLNMSSIAKMLDYDIDKLDKFCETVMQKEINAAYEELAKITKAYKNAMEMKREVIADKAVWKAKKLYALNMLDKEGVRYETPKLKIMGLEAVKSSTPKEAREALKESIRIILNEDNKTLIKYIDNFRQKFFNMPFEKIASPRGVKGITKYSGIAPGEYKLKTPIHTKAAILYNKLAKEHSLPLIHDGDKIRYAYLIMPNPVNDIVIGAPDSLPKEFKLDKYIDKQEQFNKTFLDPIQSITDKIGWNVEETISLEDYM